MGAPSQALINYFKTLKIGPGNPVVDSVAFAALPEHLQPAAAAAATQMGGLSGFKPIGMQGGPSGGTAAQVLANAGLGVNAAGQIGRGPGFGPPVGVDPNGPDDTFPAGQWEDVGVVNPVGVRTRKANPVKLLPTTLTTSAAGGGILTFSTQEAFQAIRLLVPSGQAALPGFLAQLLVGTKMISSTSGRAPLNLFQEKSQYGKLDLPVCYLGEQITATISGCTAASELSACMLGYSFGTPRARYSSIVGVHILPFDVTAVPASGTATITLSPQEHVVPRCVVFDDSVANFGTGYVQSINIENKPQFSQNSEIAIQAFGELGQDDWLDLDLCHRGGQITIGLRQSAATPFNAQGFMLCDVVVPID